MYELVSKLIVYRNIDRNSILLQLADTFRRFDSGECPKEQLTGEVYDSIHDLLDVATRYGFNGNLWHNYLAYLLAVTENPFSLVSEKKGASEGSVSEFVKNDLRVFKKLFDYDFSRIESALGINCFSVITHYNAVVKKEQIYNKSVSDKVRELSQALDRAVSEEELYTVVTDFYLKYGVGMFGLNKAFRLSEENDREHSGLLIPITNTSDVVLDDLVGYEIQKKQLIANTEAFVNGRAANNVLLYGDAGTGKSTSIKAILNQYYPQGLRLIEMYKHQFKDLAAVINRIKNRNYRFIIYMDDLSFEEFETDYKYLKAVIEGGLEPSPENVLIYATSNRRHLVREVWSDRSDQDSEDIHRNDTVQEKLSLANRFGLSIGYFKPSPAEFMNIVSVLASRYPEIQISEQELHLEANKWELRHGGLSGRTAQQFINYLVGTVSAEQ